MLRRGPGAPSPAQLRPVPLAHGNARAEVPAATLLLLARDQRVRNAARGAARLLQADAPHDMATIREALARVMAPGRRVPRLVMQEGDAGYAWPALLALALDPFAPGTLVLVQPDDAPGHNGICTARAEEAPIAAAIAALAKRLPATTAQETGAQGTGVNGTNAHGTAAQDADELLRGLHRGEIVLRYQPIVRLSDGRPLMLEALARWQRMTVPLPPDAFVPLAERSGLGRLLSIVVARRAATEMGGQTEGARLPVSINLPLAVLLEQDIVAWLRHAMKGTGMAPADLILELTETTPVRDLSALRRALTRLRHAGHRVLLDDLSLDDGRLLLIGLPFDGVKIDRDFTEALPHSHRARAAVRRIVRLAHARGMTVTAEGVADARLWRTVAALGVDHAQGWAVARPLPAAALGAWIASWAMVQPR
ncbi:EAL domain-containing protein [Humitalea sp. 24SJ18S-53]|uniref:EAL domain-containing protein n=1 Tax=Humitalea sp. 24SJ18S-53 TaxID=3422307 RepID=UPI003D6776CB